MSTDMAVIDLVLDQLVPRDMRVSGSPGRYKLMHGTVQVGIIRNRTLYIPVTDSGRALVGRLAQGSPYPGAARHFKVSRARLRDPRFLGDLVDATTPAIARVPATEEPVPA